MKLFISASAFSEGTGAKPTIPLMFLKIESNSSTYGFTAVMAQKLRSEAQRLASDS